MTIEEKVDSLLQNHIPHLSDRLSKVEGKLSVVLGVVVTSLLATVAWGWAMVFK